MLTQRLVSQVVERLEATVRLKRFNQLGGLQLDRDVRALVAALSGLTARTVRDKFAALNQARRSFFRLWGFLGQGPHRWK
jgi:hypothetical protein